MAKEEKPKKAKRAKEKPKKAKRAKAFRNAADSIQGVTHFDGANESYRATTSAAERIMTALSWAKNTGSMMVGVDTFETTDGWIPIYLLSHPFIGGSGADRRIREIDTVRYQLERRSRADEHGYTWSEIRLA